MYGSMIAVLDDGTHRTIFGTFRNHESFHKAVADTLRECRRRVRKFAYAWEGEMQEYTPGEVLEVYYHEGK